MERVYRRDSIAIMSDKLKLPEKTIKDILTEYTKYVRNKLANGESIGVLRICYLDFPEYKGFRETLAFVCTEVSKVLKMPVSTVKGVLLTYEDMIIRDLKQFYKHSIYGLISLRMTEDYNGNIKVVVSRNSLGRGTGCKFSVSRSFKRKVNVLRDDR